MSRPSLVNPEELGAPKGFSHGVLAPAGARLLFVAGQVVSDYVLTPRLVGDRIGLHPLWVIFGVFAGGAVFGFVGMLLAVPACAVIGVLARFAIARYEASPLYTGTPPP